MVVNGGVGRRAAGLQTWPDVLRLLQLGVRVPVLDF